MVKDGKGCGWSSVVAAVAVFATLLFCVPATPAVASPAQGGVSVVVRHEPGPVL